MASLLNKIGHLGEQRIDRLKSRLRDRLGDDREILIQPYQWYGTREKLMVRGRVLANKGLRSGLDDDTLWDNMLNAYRRFNTDEIPYAKVRATFGRTHVDLTCDDEGYFEGEIELPRHHIKAAPLHEVSVQLLYPEREEPVTAVAPVIVPPFSAEFGIISDIDDTILQTHATNWLRAARLTFLGNARMRMPFPGVASYYQALRDGRSGKANNPFFYVSSSPWNLYDLLTDFMELQEIPAGPLLLRDLGIDETKFITTSHSTHKKDQIEGILNTYRMMQFVLIGDSGQHDPEIYTEIVEAFPHRIRAIYIRDVSDDERDAETLALAEKAIEHGVPMLLVGDSLVAAQHSAEINLIRADALTEIASDTLSDSLAPSPIEQLISDE